MKQLALTILAALATLSCASVPTINQRTRVLPTQPVVLSVENDSWSRVNIYVMRAGSKFKLGSVGVGRVEEFEVSRGIIVGSPQFLIEPLGTRGTRIYTELDLPPWGDYRYLVNSPPVFRDTRFVELTVTHRFNQSHVSNMYHILSSEGVMPHRSHNWQEALPIEVQLVRLHQQFWMESGDPVAMRNVPPEMYVFENLRLVTPPRGSAEVFRRLRECVQEQGYEVGPTVFHEVRFWLTDDFWVLLDDKNQGLRLSGAVLGRRDIVLNTDRHDKNVIKHELLHVILIPEFGHPEYFYELLAIC